jgi:hypothetical protein
MHRPEHASSRRKNSSRIRLVIKESNSTVHDERNGPTRRWNRNIQQNNRNKTRGYESTIKEMAIKMENGDRPHYETSERASIGKQQANTATFYSKRTSKDKSIKKNLNKKHIQEQ